MDKVFEPYRLSVAPHKIHHLLYYSSLYVGDSQTMAAEAAVLGVPSLRCNSFVGKLSYLKELDQKYELTLGFLPEQSEEMLHAINELLNMKDLADIWQRKRDRMLQDKIDMTQWLLGHIESEMKPDQ